jgi:hypothetical protein
MKSIAQSLLQQQTTTCPWWSVTAGHSEIYGVSKELQAVFLKIKSAEIPAIDPPEAD